MSSLFVNNIKHTNTQDAISIDTGGNVVLDKVGTGVFYRTGTFTPILTSTGATDPNASAITGTPTFEHGHYVRIGNFVSVQWLFGCPVSFGYTNGAAQTDGLIYAGMPFTIASLPNYYPSCNIGNFASWASWAASYTPFGYGNAGTKRFTIRYAVANGTNAVQLTHAAATGNSNSIWSASYITSDA